MAELPSITSVSTLRKAPLQYPVISDEFVYLTAGRACPSLSMKARCIPLREARHCRNTSAECQSRWGILWRYYVICTWTTRETFIDIDKLFD